MYTAAAYDEALALLNQFESGALTDALEVNQYRAFCLLALGRSDDARKVIQEIVEANPTFQPPKTQVSPRLLDARCATVEEVRLVNTLCALPVAGVSAAIGDAA